MISDMYNYELIKDKIIPTLISYKGYNDVHRVPFLFDIDIVYRVMLPDREFPIVPESVFKAWNMDESKVYDNAILNSLLYFPALRTKLDDICTIASLDDYNTDDLIVLTNASCVFGASVMLYPDLMNLMVRLYGDGDVYIIPSSIHEVILVKEGIVPPEFLLDCIKSVNDICVREEDRLSYRLYRYTEKDKQFTRYVRGTENIFIDAEVRRF